MYRFKLALRLKTILLEAFPHLCDYDDFRGVAFNFRVTNHALWKAYSIPKPSRLELRYACYFSAQSRGGSLPDPSSLHEIREPHNISPHQQLRQLGKQYELTALKKEAPS